MRIAELIILIVGAVAFTVSFFLSDKESSQKLDKEEEKKKINELLSQESDGAIRMINEAAQECVSDNSERIERAMERVSNEKIMAISDYSDTVLDEIKKNHDEVVFLYDMLNNKQSQIKNTAAELNMLAKSAKAATEENVKSSQLLSQEQPKAAEGPIVENIRSDRGFGYVSSGNSKDEKRTGFGYTVSNHEEASFEAMPMEVVDAEKANVIPESKAEKSEAAGAAGEKKKAKNKADKVPVADSGLDLMFAADNNSANNNDRILELHKAGKSNMAIAKELGLGIGEVKLVIDLFEGI